jgi:hypothetical protein
MREVSARTATTMTMAVRSRSDAQNLPELELGWRVSRFQPCPFPRISPQDASSTLEERFLRILNKPLQDVAAVQLRVPWPLFGIMYLIAELGHSSGPDPLSADTSLICQGGGEALAA